MPEQVSESRPFRTWAGRESWEFVDGVRLHAIGGEQVLLCRVQYAPGKQVPWHKHDDTEQVMFVLDGEVEMTIEDDTTTLRSGDVVVVNRGLHHKLYSARRDVHGGARSRAARPRPRPRARPRARSRRRRRARGEVTMPLVRVELFERRLTPELEAQLIDRLTETLLDTLEAPELRPHTWVIVEGHDAHRWGRSGKPWDEAPDA